MASCVYCNCDRIIVNRSDRLSLKRDFYPGLDVFIDRDVLYIEGSADTYEPNYIEVSVKINFCPMCGRKLA